mgnify:CR=1 FL=1
MPRIESSTTKSRSTGGGFRVPWKVLFIVIAIGGVWAYIAYQYAQYRPRPAAGRTAQAAARGAARGGQPAVQQRGRMLDQALEKLALTPDQKTRLAALANETTSPQAFQRQAMQVLTPEQRDTVTSALAEKRAERQRARDAGEARRRRQLPGNDYNVARQGDQRIREEVIARRRAAGQQAPEASPTP